MSDAVTVRVPLSIRQRGGRKVVLSPDGSVLPGAPRQVATTADPTLLKALGRAFRWQKLLDNGTYASISDIARAEKLDRTYVGDVLRLTLLPPMVVEAIVEGQLAEGVTLPGLMKGVPKSGVYHADWHSWFDNRAGGKGTMVQSTRPAESLLCPSSARPNGAESSCTEAAATICGLAARDSGRLNEGCHTNQRELVCFRRTRGRRNVTA